VPWWLLDELLPFHSGAIKTRNLTFRQFDVLKFPFHSGTIKTVDSICKPSLITPFPFHSGTIGTNP